MTITGEPLTASEASLGEEPVVAAGSEHLTDPPADDLQTRWEQAGDAGRWVPVHRRRRRAARIVTAAVIAALAAAVVVEGLQVRHDDALSSARQSALRAAKSDAALIATYSYSSFGAYSERIKAVATPAFFKNFKTDSASLSSVLAQYKAGSTGTVVGAGIGAFSSAKATVYVFLNEAVTNSKDPASTQRARMVIDLTRHGSGWQLANATVQ